VTCDNASVCGLADRKSKMPAWFDKEYGKWRYRKRVELPDGRRIRIKGTPTVNTKKAAEHAERVAIQRLENPAAQAAPAVPDDKVEEVPTLKEYAEETVIAKYVPTLTKPSARRALTQVLRGHIIPAMGDVRLNEFRQAHVDEFVGAEKKRGRKAKTINNRLAGLSTVLGYAIDNGVIATPRVRLRCMIDGMSSEIVPVAPEDVERLLAAATDARYRVAVLLAAEAGLRAGEIRGAQHGDIRNGQIIIRRAIDNETDEVVPPKHNKMRPVPLSPRLAEAISALPRRGLWIVSRLDGDLLGYYGLNEGMGRLYERAGVERPPKLIHCLRHTFGTVMAGKGVPLPVLQDLMGHVDLNTTRRYIQVNEQQKRAAIAKVFGPELGPENAVDSDESKKLSS
jgi:integrase